MITREMIRNGFESGTVSIEEEYAGCIGICCRIGDNAFYFLGSEDDDLTKEEYWESYTLDMTIDMIFNILKDVEYAEEYGLDETELDYYTSVLAYQPNETKIYMNGERKMLYVAVKWKDGTVTHRTYNDLYVLEKQYTETEIREIYKNNPDVEYINIAK